MARNRVVVTGMGVVAPNGIGLKPFWKSILNGESGIGPITRFDASSFKSRIAGEVKNFRPEDYITPGEKPARMARHTQFAYAATMMALVDAGFDPACLDFPSPTPVIIGVSSSAMDVLEKAFDDVGKKGPNRAAPSTAAHMIPQAAANIIADRIGICADSATVSSACPSGLDAISLATEMIRSGEAEIAIAGGTDTPITPLALSMFIAGGMSSCRNDEPERASRPFDLDRDSGVLSEGAGVMVLENFERAQARGAEIKFEIRGYGKTRDRESGLPGSGLERSMNLALANARMVSRDIDYISAYGPGHPVLDATEVQSIKNVFGRYAYHVPVNSIKGVTGNAMAAGGPFQLIACAMSLRDQLIAPTANYENPDPACDLSFASQRPLRTRIETALVNVRGIGGSAASMVISRVLS